MDYPVFTIKEIAEVKSKTKDLEKLFDDIIKCTPDYIQELPYDLRTNDVEKLTERFDEIDNRLSELEEELDELDYDTDGTDFNLYEYWKEDREEWKASIDKFENEDTPRLERKMQLIDEIKAEWETLKGNYDTSSLKTLGGQVDTEINNLDSVFTVYTSGSTKVPPISVLQDEIIPYDLVVKNTGGGGRYMTYFGDDYNTIGKDNKWTFNLYLNNIKRLNKDGSLDGIISKMEEIKSSPRKVQNEAKKYTIMKEHYDRLEGNYQSQGGDDPYDKTQDPLSDYSRVKREYDDLLEEAKRTYNKLISLS